MAQGGVLIVLSPYLQWHEEHRVYDGTYLVLTM